MITTGETKLTCGFCTRQFSRREHLTRHLSSHVNQRLHQCGSCGKAFNRCDLLTRHSKISCSAVPKNTPKDPQTRTRFACDGCAKAKVRCSTTVPCIRCQKKGISCLRKPLGRSADPTVPSDVFPLNPPLLDRSASIQGRRAGSRSLIMLENLETQPSPVEINTGDDPYGPLFDWSFQNCTPPQRLSTNFLDLLAFPGNALQLNPPNFLGPHDAAPGQMDADALANEPARQAEQLTSPRMSNLSDSWYQYGGSGMVQENMWDKLRPSEAVGSEYDANSTAEEPEWSSTISKSTLNLLSLQDILAMEDHGHVARVQPSQMGDLSALIANEHCPRTSSCPPGIRGLLNNPQVINSFVQLYFEHFHPTLPLLHKATFNVSDIPPLLMLSVATIGSRFSKIARAHTLSTYMAEILRRAIDRMLEENIHQTIQIPFAQAALLNQIQMAYQGSRHLALKAQFQRAMLVTVCRGLSSRNRREDMRWNLDNGTRTSSHDSEISKWIGRELCRRLTYGIWLIECQFSLNANVPPMMSLEDLDPGLPCPETLWDLNHTRTVRLEDALNASKLAGIVESPNLGLFARSIVMTAIFYQWHTATRVDRYILHARVEEHSEQDHEFNALFGSDYNLPAASHALVSSNPLVSAVHRAKLRTAASETINRICKDIKNGPESDSYQLMKLYHHISILLIVPLQPMCEYIGWMATKQCTKVARESLCAWIHADIQNARKAVLHAITLFCLVRRRKSPAHSESHHLFIAFLTIWTFFSLDSVPEPGDGDGPTPEELPCCCIDWDGRVDLDLQERWIQAPGHPRVRIAGVGNLEAPSGMHRILVETHHILLSDRVWGISQLFAGVLESLVSQGSQIT
ncbi:fungal-specific transcription factor domain-containing protein [Aspergillus granulosus]|uniref:Fungal-specific transcription factor domain-containing protein n=1 Tax=Aspergillus granulosus TaxID=176169 RepID=A0ABR4H894_9EURO